MPERQYPFIDIAVHARVREHFARGDASVLFSKNVARVLWANDQGAKLFGTASVYDFIDTDLDPSDLSLRQLRATAAQLAAVGDRRQLLIRMASGFRRLPLNAAVEMILIGPGEEAILFTVPNNGKALSTEARAEAMIAGLDGPDTHMAVLDADGTVIAGSPGFESLGLSADIRRTLVAAAASDKDRLIKRPVATEKGRLPAAVGKISDHPALHLLFAVEAILEKSETEEAVGAAAQEQAIPAAPAAPVETREAVPSSAAPAETEQPAGRLEEAEPAPSPEAAAPAEHEASVGDGTDDEAQGELAPQDEDNAADLAEPETPLEAEPASGEPAADADRGGETADFAFAAGGRAVRFVWKIDAEGRFSEISEEFASAVGPKAADVIGVSFTDLADRYDLDPDDKINELLHRRDTWSGKTIFWPVQGTNLKVPVDLAALPTYSRSREFDGFRGFGIVRIADAVPDAKAAGLALDRPAQIAQDSSDMSSAGAGAPQAEAGSKTGPAAGSGKDAAEAAPDVSEDPFRGEQPALRVVETPGRQASDKVIDLDERRPAGAGALTRGEQAAFREIARQLGEPFAPDPLPQEGKAEGRHEADTSPSTPADTEESRQTEEAEAPGGRHDPTPAGETPAAAMEPGLTARNGAAMSSEILDRLPVALLVHHGDALLHANAEFLRLTGYENLEAFEQEGGLEALFALGNEAGASEAEKQAREDEGAAEASRLRMEIDELRSIL
ncbi:PAS domain-containing protein, partial [Sinorhizobium meliloti]|uniref:PAS domain-containing protein n=1 Tax=Rhizobium meliloti TaxID=382 RepID=UPI000FD89590